MNRRIEFIDLAKGICILLIVLLHVFGDMSGVAIKVMNLFRMPLYFILSGLFFKTYNGFCPFVKKKINKLLIPFLFVFIFIVIPSTILLDLKTGNAITWDSVFWDINGKLNLGIDGAIWFLLCLFWVNVFFYIIFLLSRSQMYGVVILSILCGLIGYLLNFYNQYLLIWMDSALTAMPFFMFGYVLRQYSHILDEKFSIKDLLLLLVSLILLVAVFLYNEAMGRDVIGFARNEFNIHIISLYTGGVAGTISVFVISKYFGHLPIVSYVGRYSIVVLLTHLLYLFVIRNILYQAGIPQDDRVDINILVFVALVILSLPTIKICIKYLPYCFAQKDLLK